MFGDENTRRSSSAMESVLGSPLTPRKNGFPPLATPDEHRRASTVAIASLRDVVLRAPVIEPTLVPPPVVAEVVFAAPVVVLANTSPLRIYGSQAGYAALPCP